MMIPDDLPGLSLPPISASGSGESIPSGGLSILPRDRGFGVDVWPFGCVRNWLAVDLCISELRAREVFSFVLGLDFLGGVGERAPEGGNRLDDSADGRAVVGAAIHFFLRMFDELADEEGKSPSTCFTFSFPLPPF